MPLVQTASLYRQDGQRKYLTAEERARFLASAEAHPRPEIGTLCLLLAYSGCRISEALELTGPQVNPADGLVAIRSLKKRERLVIREIPLPGPLLCRLGLLARGQGRLWPLSRNRAWQLVRAVMRAAAIRPGPQSSPRSLRHGFGVHAIRSGVPLTLVQRWLGHASLATTALHTQAVGPEERTIALRMWA